MGWHPGLQRQLSAMEGLGTDPLALLKEAALPSGALQSLTMQLPAPVPGSLGQSFHQRRTTVAVS